MAEYTLQDNACIGADFNGLFQTAEFFRLHAGDYGHYFEWASNAKVLSSVHFTPMGADGLWRSPARGTFAGFATQDGIYHKELFAFYDAVELALRGRGAKQLEVLPAPMAHDPNAFSNQLYLLRTCGYEVTHCDLNQSLEVDARALSDRMTYGNLKRLRKCQREGLIGERLPLSALPDVYETISANRLSKGHSMSMSFNDVQVMANTFPDAVVLFGCRDQKSLAAAGLCLRLSSAVLYVFYWGDRPGYESFSPVVSVANAIYSYAQDEQIRLVDVGTSTLDRSPNFGLLAFKRGLGFCESLKVRMSKKL